MIDLGPIFDALQAAAANDPRRAAFVLRFALQVLTGKSNRPAPLPECAWRGPLIEKCSCGDVDRDIYACAKTEMTAAGMPGKIPGKLCRDCKYRAAPAAPLNAL